MVEDWDGCFENPQWLYEYYTSAEYGWEVVADNDGIYPEKMMGLDVGAEFNIDFDEFYDKLYRRALR
jgi:hypothetical protein